MKKLEDSREGSEDAEQQHHKVRGFLKMHIYTSLDKNGPKLGNDELFAWMASICIVRKLRLARIWKLDEIRNLQKLPNRRNYLILNGT